MDYHGHITKVQRTPTVFTDQYPNAHLTKKIVYEEDEIEGSRRHHHHLRHHNPETRERVEVIEYEQVPEYNNRVGEVIYEENVDVETDQYYPGRNRGSVNPWNTYRQ